MINFNKYLVYAFVAIVLMAGMFWKIEVVSIIGKGGFAVLNFLALGLLVYQSFNFKKWSGLL